MLRTTPLVLLAFALAGCPEEDGQDSDTGAQTAELDADNDGFTADVDCDDDNPDVHPDAVEICDGIDNDCAEGIDFGASDTVRRYLDLDDDGFGDPAQPVDVCPGEDLVSEDNTDCDDQNDAAYPGAPEVCDRADNDCDQAVDFDGWIPGTYATIPEAAAVGGHFCLDDGTYVLNGLEFDTDFWLEGSGTDKTTLDGQFTNMIVSDTSFRASRMTVTNVGSVNREASFVEGYGFVGVYDVNFENINDTGGNGDVIYAEGNLEAHNVLFESPVINLTSTFYGLIYGYEGSMDLNNVTVRNGDFDGTGSNYGTFMHEIGQLTLKNVLIENNTYDFGNSTYGLVVLEEGDAYDPAHFSNIVVKNNTVNTGTTFYGAFSMDDFEAELTIRNVQIVGNTITSKRAYSLFGYGDDEIDATYDNVIIAGNTFTVTEDAATIMGDFYGGTITNWDVYRNVIDSPMSTVMFDLNQDWTVRNVNIVDNDLGNDFDGVFEARSLDLAYINIVDDLPTNDFVDNNGPASVLMLTSYDPEYTSTEGLPDTWDLRLSSSSRLIDAGDPELYDADTTRSDIGAYGGAHGQSW